MASWINCCNPVSKYAILVPDGHNFCNYLELQGSYKTGPFGSCQGGKIFVTKIFKFFMLSSLIRITYTLRICHKRTPETDCCNGFSLEADQGPLARSTELNRMRRIARVSRRQGLCLPAALRQATGRPTKRSRMLSFQDSQNDLFSVFLAGLLDQREVLVAVPGHGNLLLIHLIGHHFSQINNIIGC